MATRTFAAIDVGSYELAMKIIEFDRKGNMKQIEHIRHRLDLGTDTYHTGKVSVENMNELCKVLSEFAQIMKAYKVDAYKAYGTSAIREADNTILVREQIRTRTGLDVDVISNSEQRFLNYKSVASRGIIFDDFIKDGTVIMDIGGGSIQISLFDNASLVTTKNIRLGVLRVQDMLHHLSPRTRDFDEVLDELIDNQLYFFKRQHLKGKDIKNIILVDDYISNAIGNIHPDTQIIETAEFKEMARLSKSISISELAKKFKIAEEMAELMVPAIAMVSRLIKITKAETIWLPGVDISDGIAYEYGESEKLINNPHDFENDIVSAAEVLAKRYNSNKDRNQLVERVAMEIFDSTKKLHQLDKRDRLLLRIAAILGDCGRFMSLEAAAECGYQIIMANEMIGLSHMEREIVANVVRFNKLPFKYYDELSSEIKIDKASYIRVAKLSALFRIADGICRSHRVKVNSVRATIKDNELILSVDSDESMALEKGFFYRKSALFEEMFSVKCRLKYKKKSVGI